jgi:hypothetical protein
MTSWCQKNPYTLRWCKKDVTERDTNPKHISFGVKKWFMNLNTPQYYLEVLDHLRKRVM